MSLRLHWNKGYRDEQSQQESARTGHFSFTGEKQVLQLYSASNQVLYLVVRPNLLMRRRQTADAAGILASKACPANGQ